MSVIKRSKVIVSNLSNEFEDMLENAINRMQAENLDVEVQYQMSYQHGLTKYSAVLIGRQK